MCLSLLKEQKSTLHLSEQPIVKLQELSEVAVM